MNIRRTTKQDIPALLRLLSQVLEIHAKLRPDVFNQGTVKYNKEDLLEMIDDKDVLIYVIEDKEILGHAFCQVRDSKVPDVLKRKCTFYIDDFCIDESVRGKHLGEALFTYLKEEAIRLGCEEITLNCWIDNESAVAFYKKMGFKPRSYIMEYIIK